MISKFGSNFGKAIFLGWIRSIIAFFAGIIVALIVFGTLKDFVVALVVFALFPFVIWVLDILIRWKTFTYDGNTLVLKRILRPVHRFAIEDNLINIHYTEHSLFFLSIFVEPTVRFIDLSGRITDVRCSFMTEATAKKMLNTIVSDKRRRAFVEGQFQEFGGEIQ